VLLYINRKTDPATLLLDTAYRHESDADFKERILLVRRVMSDGNKEIVTICEEESWTYKRLARFKREGLDGLKDKSRSSRPLAVPEQMLLLKLRRELSENQSSGWRVKEVMNLIYERTGMSIDSHKWGFN